MHAHARIGRTLARLWSRFVAWIRRRALLRRMRDELTETVLETVLEVMRLTFLVDRSLRPVIEGFRACYVLESRSRGVKVRVEFQDGEMTFDERPAARPDATLVFKDDAAVMRYLFDPHPDLLDALLTQEVTFEGNLNYLYRFAFVARRFRTTLLGP